MHIINTPRFGKTSAPEGVLTLEALQKVLDSKKTLDDTKKAMGDTPVAVIIREEKKEETVYKKARDLTHDEKISIEKAKLQPFGPWYKSLATPVDQYMVSPRWEAVKNAHYSGALGAGFGAVFGKLATNYGALAASTANALHNLPVVGSVFGNGDLPVHWAGDETTLPFAMGLSGLAATGAAVGKYFSTQKENEDYETFMRLHPEKASKFNLISDERVQKIRGDWDQTKTDSNLERRVLGWFAPSSVLPGELLPNQQRGWVFPWNMTTALTAPLQSIPIVGGFLKPVHEAIETAQNDGRTPSPSGNNWSGLGQQIVNTPGQVYGLVRNTIATPFNAGKALNQDLRDAASNTAGVRRAAGNTASAVNTLGRFVNAYRRTNTDTTAPTPSSLNKTLMEIELMRRKNEPKSLFPFPSSIPRGPSPSAIPDPWA